MKLTTVKQTLTLFTFFMMTTNQMMAQQVKASTQKTTFHRETKVSIAINADATIIWKLLTTADNYPSWNSTIVSIDGTISLGETIKLKSKLDVKRVFKLKIKQFEPNKKLVWGDGMGNRIFMLEKLENGLIQFTMLEKIGGIMFPLFAGMIPSFDDSFEHFAMDLKTEAEKIMHTK